MKWKLEIHYKNGTKHEEIITSKQRYDEVQILLKFTLRLRAASNPVLKASCMLIN